MEHSREWLFLISSFVSGAAGVGAAWGILRQKMIDIERRLVIVEIKIESQVGMTRCDHMRDECKVNIGDKIAEVKSEIISLRNLVISKF